ncbi:ABC transporter permease [Bacillus cytotoxicus]|uniref:ABC transporter permease n=1 Tax=Bacillus cereus group sp. BfR-BA-01492 TaxID=2920361 RepID=UPI001F585E10|nr:ABC transporter permease [Bacillus cereus group sp. BfR-BA-01492]EMA6341431.1 ABC transporter permease [Bacillus cytotoxicus]
MFQKALWLRTYHQSKYIVWLFWLVSFYLLSYKYYMASAQQLYFLELSRNYWKEPFHYYYSLSLIDPIIAQGAILITLACVLIGWGRQSQSMDFLWSMPFKPTHLFLTKWLFGVCNIIVVVMLNWGLFGIIKKTTFHNKYQIFSPFHTYYIYMLIILIAIYTLAICIGAIAGNIISQGFITASILILPYILPAIIVAFITIHTNPNSSYDVEKEYSYGTVLEKISIVGPAQHFHILFDYDPQRAYTDHDGVRHDEPNFTYIPSSKTLIGPLVNILILLPIGMFLYNRSPNELNGKIFIYSKIKKIFFVCSVLIVGLIGGAIVQNYHSLLIYYIGFLGASSIAYFLLSRLLKWKLSWNVK